MRIVGGTHRGRKLAVPTDRDIRPTSDRARESVFNILEHRLEGGFTGKTVLDAFAGTGANGLEALSRGATHVAFIDNARKSLALAQENIRTLSAQTETTVLQQDATQATQPPPTAGAPCDVVFLDPPYHQNLAGLALRRLAEQGWLADGALCVVEIARKETFDAPEGFTAVDERTYGAARVILLNYS